MKTTLKRVGRRNRISFITYDKEETVAIDWSNAKCHWCKVAIPSPTKNQKSVYYASGHMYCSKKCSGEFNAEKSAKVMADTNRKYASARMLKHNPMHDPKAKAKMIRTIRAMKIAPKVRGGNGTGPTKTELLLSQTLAAKWNFIVHTSKKRDSGYPNHYKIDVAIPEHKIAFEIDGFSHSALSRQKQDKKKTKFLRSLGWTVHRLTNQQVLTLCAPTKKIA
jgi:hypothetical protein